MKKLLKDLFNVMWTLVGLFIAWMVLEGETRTIATYVLVGGIIVWLATFKIRNHEETKGN